jgi:hypothetical protein
LPSAGWVAPAILHALYLGVVEVSVFGYLMSNEIFVGSDMAQVNT